ncbi:MAG: hypothetical protein FOGNACKC_04525 [Anaerolineae bacterium]|nr:hypothetical protein [Anaerolineae bacterium]
MSKRYARLLKNQDKVKVMAQSYNHQKDNLIWLLTLGAAAAASVAYLFSFFFSFTGGRAPAGD